MHQERQRMAGQYKRLLMLLCWCAGMPSGQQQSAALPAPPIDVATRSGHAQSAGQTELPANQVVMTQTQQAAGQTWFLLQNSVGQLGCCCCSCCCCVSMAWSFLIELHHRPDAGHVHVIKPVRGN